MTDADESKTPQLSTHEVDEILASVSPQKLSGAGEIKEQRNTQRYRVKWKAEIITDDKMSYQGFINDISTQGTSIFLNTSISPKKCTLHIFVPPLSSVSKPHILEATGNFVYVVFDGGQQLFRLAIRFLCFNPDSDRKLLERHLTKHHSPIHEY